MVFSQIQEKYQTLSRHVKSQFSAFMRLYPFKLQLYTKLSEKLVLFFVGYFSWILLKTIA
jgi:hypothetical protein